jgi:protein-disulfide isomerase
VNKKILILGMIVVVITVTIFASSSTPETVNLDMTKMHDALLTSMVSPILGNPSAPITIVKFGDYLCHQCYNWYHNTKPSITRDYIDTGKVTLVFMDLAFLGNDTPKTAQPFSIFKQILDPMI